MENVPLNLTLLFISWPKTLIVPYLTCTCLFFIKKQVEVPHRYRESINTLNPWRKAHVVY